MSIDEQITFTINVIQFFYVSPNGNDNWPGSLEYPWRTINKANTTLLPGQTVLIREGTYQETISPINSSNLGNYITYKNYPNETVIIRDVQQGANLVNKSYIEIDGLTFTNTSLNWIRMNNTGGGSSDYNIIQNCDFTKNNEFAGFYLRKASYNKIIDNTFDGADAEIIEQDFIYMRNNATHNLIQGNDFGDAKHGCLNIVGDGGTTEYGEGPRYNVVRDNYFRTTLHTALLVEMNAYHNLVENNIIFENSINTDNHVAAGLQLDATANIIRNNVIYNGRYDGLILNAYYYQGTFKHCNNNRIYNNTIYGNGGNWYYPAQGNPYLFGGGHQTNTLEPITNNILKNNIFYKNRSEEHDVQNILYFSSDPVNEKNIFSHNIIIQNQAGDAQIKWCGNTLRTLNWVQSNYPSLWFNNIDADPMFTNPEAGDFTLQPSSPAVDAGDWLTYTVGSGTGTQITVEDAGYFCDGFEIIEGDNIKIGSNPVVRIININYTTNTIIIENPISWNDGDPVSLPYQGNRPNIGIE